MSSKSHRLRLKFILSALASLLLLTAAGVNAQENVGTSELTFDSAAWQYDADNNVYWQIGVVYVANPAAPDYESLGIYVPGDYLNATDNGDGSYTAALNTESTVNGYTALTAPIVFPVNTPGYSAAAAPTSYSYDPISSYMQAGFVYVQAGARGRDNGYDANGNLIYSGGAPWGVTDFKAAVRYVRYNEDALPGSTDRIFVFGMSGGGAQASVIGATGDSELYFPYLQAVGAAMVDTEGNAISDAVLGAMAWCPITSLDYADAAYEWNMGQYASSGTRADDTWTSALSADLAETYATTINALGLTDESGNSLTLEPSETGIYTAGSYYDYLLAVIEESLNNFLADTTFPYTVTAGSFGGMRGGAPPSGGMTLPDGGTSPSDSAAGSGSRTAESATYETVEDYIASLNAEAQWVTYDAATHTARITSIADFVAYGSKSPSKSVGAFDDLNRGQAENNVFGNDGSDSLHFDAVLAELLAQNQEIYAAYADWDASYIEAYAADLTALDALGSDIQSRMNMYNPMYFLLASYDGYRSSTVAPYWRIHSGIEQGDTAMTVELNLALALESYEGVQDVAFATVWDQGHTTAERTGNSTGNFIAWVNEIVGQ